MPASSEAAPTLVLPGVPPNGGEGTLSGESPERKVSFRPSAEDRAAARASAGRRISVGSAVPWENSLDSQGLTRQRGSSKEARRKLNLRYWLSRSRWYHSAVAARLRGFLQGKFFAGVMVTALFLALFLPDIWILAGINSNVAIDTVLTCVMVLFAFELMGLSAVDVTYFISFFQLMDIIGTISMMFDISYMAGSDATYATVLSDATGSGQKFMLLRAARAAKVGARAGRLSRVLRILRFLPFLTGGGVEKGRTGIASLISSQLANVLATRVACLTIILVMVTPLFDAWTFPQFDYSLMTWTGRVSRDVQDARMQDALDDLAAMNDFYSKYDYFPWMACIGRRITTNGQADFECNSNSTLALNWTAVRGPPPRGASTFRVVTDTFMVAFNMHSTLTVKAGLSITTVVFVIFIMVFSGLALSSVVTELAVRPLERMLETVRKIAATVFKLSADIQDGLVEDETADIDSSNEMKLLEKVVQKLATVAELQSAKNIEATEDMHDEDIGILNMMQGRNIVDEQRAAAQARKSCAVPRKKAAVPTIRLEDFGVSHDVYNSWSFNPLPLSKAQRVSLAIFTISRFHESSELFITTQSEAQTLQRFIQAVEKEYMPVPFHSFAHALDVTHGVARLLHITSSETFLTELEQFSLLIAGSAHDLGHPGVNNGFLSEVGHELALQYNDRSPLENMHCAKLYTIVANPATNVFGKLSKEQYKEARKCCIECILHTDMMVHGSMVKDLQMTYQMNQEVFNMKPDATANPFGGSLQMAEIEVFLRPETKMLVMECLLHSADVSNPCRDWEVTHAWALVCLEEFFAQGDQEKMLGVPVQFLNDRDKLNRPNSQIGFIEFMIAPFFAAQLRLWPGLRELGENLGNNLANWADMWERDSSPTEEERQKVQARVQRVRDNLQDAGTRGGNTS